MMVHDANTELDALRIDLDTSAEQEAMMSMTTTTHLTKLVAENLNLRNELVSCKGTHVHHTHTHPARCFDTCTVR
jgi:hypothetical protein